MKKYWFCEKPAILVEAEKAQRKFHPVWLLLLYSILTILLVRWLYQAAEPLWNSSESFNSEVIVELVGIRDFHTIIPAFLVILIALFVEKRSLASLGLKKNRALKKFIIWTLSLFGIVVFLSGIFTLPYYLYEKPFGDEVVGLPFSAYIPLIMVGMIVFATCKSIMGYGFLLVSMANRMKYKNALLWICVFPPLIQLLINLYFPVEGFPETRTLIIDTICIIFLRFLLSLVFLRTGSIWPVAAMAAIGWFVLSYVLPSDVIWNSGIYIMLIVISILAVLFWPKKTLVNQEGAGVVSQ